MLNSEASIEWLIVTTKRSNSRLEESPRVSHVKRLERTSHDLESVPPRASHAKRFKRTSHDLESVPPRVSRDKKVIP
ncbi:hypothetical protein DSO57_1001624 [Entomophthora muscae]|uniref:Uncharacterized protein n=1 Tax=Entomophthora muscae TaxID=34485 RepID=A0ACC2S063_9FUNG|nr:hypothetical protein DSO57_1001624 [Entomophthora muscae]